MVRPHLVESSYCMSSLNHFLNKKKRFLIVAAIQKRISKILKLANISREKG